MSLRLSNNNNNNKTKKLKMDHEPVRAMAEPPRKIYHEAHQKATANDAPETAPPRKVHPAKETQGR